MTGPEVSLPGTARSPGRSQAGLPAATPSRCCRPPPPLRWRRLPHPPAASCTNEANKQTNTAASNLEEDQAPDQREELKGTSEEHAYVRASGRARAHEGVRECMCASVHACARVCVCTCSFLCFSPLTDDLASKLKVSPSFPARDVREAIPDSYPRGLSLQSRNQPKKNVSTPSS